jgi:hypothetical protein
MSTIACVGLMCVGMRAALAQAVARGVAPGIAGDMDIVDVITGGAGCGIEFGGGSDGSGGCSAIVENDV